MTLRENLAQLFNAISTLPCVLQSAVHSIDIYYLTCTAPIGVQNKIYFIASAVRRRHMYR